MSASHSVCFGGGFRKLKLMQLACSSEGGEGNKYVGFAMFGDIMQLSHIEVLVVWKAALKFGLRYKGNRS